MRKTVLQQASLLVEKAILIVKMYSPNLNVSFNYYRLKKEYGNRDFLCLVDNARTHTAAELSINDFGMKPGTKCCVEKIEFIDEQNKKQIINCYDNDGKSKVLLALAYELNVVVPNKYSLQQLKSLLAEHVASKKVNRLFVFVIHHKSR